MVNATLNISFEFFPPKTETGLPNLLATAQSLEKFNPEFFSVTFGAGGTSKIRTFGTVFFLKNNLQTKVTPHLTCIGSTKHELRKILNIYQQKGINHIVALRGDLPLYENRIEELKYGNELVDFIRKETNDHFKIEVAAYPDFHPDTLDPKVDIENFKRKVDAGADTAITQYFFNPDAYFRFVDDCQKMHINTPIIPGIMPIVNWERLKSFSQMCGADIPLWLFKRFENYENDSYAIREYGCEITTHLCERLIKAGVDGFHFYTLNRLEPTLTILNNLGL